MATMADIAGSPILLALVIGGLVYITAFSVIYLLKAYKRALELGVSKEDLMRVIKSSAVFTIVPAISVAIGLFALIGALGTIWSWWRLSVIGSLSYETLFSGNIASALNYASATQMMGQASGREFGIIMILMSVGMLSGFLVLIPFGKKYSTSVDKSQGGGNPWRMVFSGCFMLVLLAVYVPLLLFGDSIQAAVMVTGLIVAIILGILAKKPKLAWLNDFIMAISMIVGMASAILWTSIFG